MASTGFSASGGNAIRLTHVGATDSLTPDASAGTYFWNLSANQINATLANGMAAGQWLLSVKNACGATMTGSAEAVNLDLTGAVVQDTTGVTLTGTQIAVEQIGAP